MDYYPSSLSFELGGAGSIEAFKQAVPQIYPIISLSDVDSLFTRYLNGCLPLDEYTVLFLVHELGSLISELEGCWQTRSPVSPNSFRQGNLALAADYIQRRTDNGIVSIRAWLLMALLLQHDTDCVDRYITNAMEGLARLKESGNEVELLWLSAIFLTCENPRMIHLRALGPFLSMRVVPDNNFLQSNFGTTFAFIQKSYLHSLQKSTEGLMPLHRVFRPVTQLLQDASLNTRLSTYQEAQIAKADAFMRPKSQEQERVFAHQRYLRAAQQLDVWDRMRGMTREANSLLELARSGIDRPTWNNLSDATLDFLSWIEPLIPQVGQLYKEVLAYRQYFEPQVPESGFLKPFAMTPLAAPQPAALHGIIKSESGGGTHGMYGLSMQ
ncbi:hypothetical protein ACJZ2D_016226 [Fusarium nematophilum]